MNYVKVTDSWILSPYSLTRFRRDNPNVSFPKDIPESTLADFGVFPITETAAPSGVVVEEAPPALINGKWVQQWMTRDYTTEEFIRAQEALQAEIVQATQERLDAFAETRNYGGILSACTYATSAVPAFAAEGQRAVNLRDATWAGLYTILEEVQTGVRPMPAGFDDIEPDLPELIW